MVYLHCSYTLYIMPLSLEVARLEGRAYTGDMQSICNVASHLLFFESIITIRSDFFMQQPKAILFDLDGVLTDTSEYHYLAWKHLADDEGIPFTSQENDEHLRGVSRRQSLMYIIRDRHYSEDQIQEMMERKNNYYLELIKTMSPKDLIAGGRELLQ